MATNNTVQYTITAKDQASAVFAQVATKAKGVGAGIAESFAVVGAAAFAMRGVVSDGFKVMTGDFSKLGSLFGALPGPIGMVGQAVGDTLGKMLQDTVDAAEGFRKLSERTGASVEFLSGFTEAADDVFVKSETVSASLGIFAKKLGGVEDAMDGSGISAGAFSAKLREIGINTDNVEEALLTVADRFKDMKDGTEKSALAVQLFGKQGMELIPILNKGRDGINEMSAAAKAMGLVMTDETIASVREMKQAQDELNDTVEGFTRTIGRMAIPALNDFGKGMKDNRSITFQVVEALYPFARVLTIVNERTNTLKREQDEQTAALYRGRDAYSEISGRISAVIPIMSAFTGIVGEGGDAFAEIAGRMITTNGAIVTFGGAMSGAVPPTQAMKDAALGVNSAVGEMPLVYDNAMRATTIYKLATGQLSFETFKVETASRAVTKALMEGKLTTEEAAALYQGLADKSITTEGALKRAGKAGEDAGKLIDTMNASLGKVKSKDVSLTFQAWRTPEYSSAVGEYNSQQSRTVTITYNSSGGTGNVPGTQVESDAGGNNGGSSGGGYTPPYTPPWTPTPGGHEYDGRPREEGGIKTSKSFTVNNPGIIINSVNGAAIAQQIARGNANVARRARSRASLMG